jgi:hypothetical protein
MLNKQPVFIVAFARGGSNLLLNLLLSHPDLCIPRGELHQVFKGKRAQLFKGIKTPDKEPLLDFIIKNINYLPIIFLEKRDVFNKNHQHTISHSLKPITRKLIDRILFLEKLKAINPGENLYKTEGILYTHDEIRTSRLLCKNLDGLAFLSQELARIYPDATFIALVRNGLAICEGKIRRGQDPAVVAKQYHTVCQQMITDSKVIDNYHIYRYEDLVNNPQHTCSKIFEQAKLDPEKIIKVRLQTKPVIDSSGTHHLPKGTTFKALTWYEKDKFHKHLHPQANKNQINNLSHENKKKILDNCRESLHYFNYIT